MKTTRGRLSLAFRLWVLATVFVWPFVGFWGLAAWAVVGAGLALWWRVLPEDPPQARERLPYQHLYSHLEHPPPEPVAAPGQPGVAREPGKSL